jgi:hypothetical protein
MRHQTMNQNFQFAQNPATPTRLTLLSMLGGKVRVNLSRRPLEALLKSFEFPKQLYKTG